MSTALRATEPRDERASRRGHVARDLDSWYDADAVTFHGLDDSSAFEEAPPGLSARIDALRRVNPVDQAREAERAGLPPR